MSRYMYEDEKGFKYLQTGDHYFDKWEREHADGIVPDVMEGFSDEQRHFIEKVLKSGKTVEERIVGTPPATSELDDFDETY